MADWPSFARFRKIFDLDFIKTWNTVPGQYYKNIGDSWPEHMDSKHVKALTQYYRAMPEEFHSMTDLVIITPANVHAWLKVMSSLHIHAQECMSGSSRLSLTLLANGFRVAFPVDYRYGWGMRFDKHQCLVDTVGEELKIAITFYSPRCSPWSVASNRADPAKRDAQR